MWPREPDVWWHPTTDVVCHPTTDVVCRVPIPVLVNEREQYRIETACVKSKLQGFKMVQFI